MASAHEPATLLYVVSATRSGSTLLDLLLGNHEETTSVGELRRLHEHHRNGLQCSCGLPVPRCEFWRSVDHQLSQSGRSLQDLSTSVRASARSLGFLPTAIEILPVLATHRLLESTATYLTSVRQGLAAASNCWLTIEAIARATGAEVVVDSSKWADQFKLLYLLRPEQARLIYLVRDGRGVTSSWFRRIGGPFWKLALSWTLNNLRAILLQASMPKNRRLLVRYEDLCRDPEGEMQRICTFVGLPFQEQMLALDRRDRHNIGGSSHRFDTAETQIVLDERWRTSLSSRQVAQFNRIGGFLNRYFGYTN